MTQVSRPDTERRFDRSAVDEGRAPDDVTDLPKESWKGVLRRAIREFWDVEEGRPASRNGSLSCGRKDEPPHPQHQETGGMPKLIGTLLLEGAI